MMSGVCRMGFPGESGNALKPIILCMHPLPSGECQAQTLHLQARFRVVAQMPSRDAASLSPTPNWPCRSSSRSFLPGFPLLPVP